MGDVTYTVRLRDQVTRSAARVALSFNRIGESANMAAQSIDSMGLLAGGAAIGGLFALGAELEKTQVFFNTLTGSAEAGAKIFGELTEFANMTPFSNRLVNKNAQVLMQFGATADSVIDTLRMLGDVSGGDSERFKGVSLAFGQMSAAGRLMGQDLLQMINAGFNPLQTISQQSGKSMLELKKQMEKGLISAKMVTQAFKDASGEGGKFYQMTEKMSKTMSGLWSTAMGKATFLASEFGLSLKGLFMPFLQGALDAIEYISRFRKDIFPLAEAVLVAAGSVVVMVGAIKAWVAIQSVLNALLVANPLGLVIVAIAALVGILVAAYRHSEAFRTMVHGTWAALQAFTTVLVAQLKPAIDAVLGVVYELGAAFNWFIGLFEGTSVAAFNLSEILGKTFVGVLANAMTVVKGVTGTFSELFFMIKHVARVIVALVTGDFKGFKDAWKDLGRSISMFFIDRIKLAVKAIALISEAVMQVVRGEWELGAGLAARGAKQLVGAIVNVDTDETAKQAKHAAKVASDAFNKGASSISLSDSKKLVPGATNTLKALPTTSTQQANKLKGQNVTGGGINTFNVNIQSLQGIGQFVADTDKAGANKASQLINQELLKALATLKPV